MKSVELKFSKTSTHIVSVRVYKTLGAMRSFTSKKGHKSARQAMGSCWQANQPGHDDCVAEIHLAETHLSVDTIAHEAMHAAWHRVRLQGLKVDHGDFQEYVAISTGLLTDAIIGWCDQQKLKMVLGCVPSRRVTTVGKPSRCRAAVARN